MSVGIAHAQQSAAEARWPQFRGPGGQGIAAAGDGGTVVVFKAGDKFEVLATNDFDEGIMATPALVDGKIYLRTAGHMYAFGQ